MWPKTLFGSIRKCNPKSIGRTVVFIATDVNKMQKKDWVAHIEEILAQGRPFFTRILDNDKAQILFAVDVFRRRRHDVHISLEPSHTQKAILHVAVDPLASAMEFTIRRDQRADSILAQMSPQSVKVVTVRGCGTVVNTVCQVAEAAIHAGWYIEKNVLNTLTQTGTDNIKQRNTTLLIVLRRGSNLDSI